MRQPDSSTRITGSLTASFKLPGSTVVRVPVTKSSGRSASTASIHQCFDAGVAHER